MNTLPVRAYTDRISYEPGERVSVHVDAGGADIAVDLVKMLDSVEQEHSRDQSVEWESAGTYSTEKQSHCVGSFVHGPTGTAGRTEHTAVTLGASIWSAAFRQPEPQVLVSISDRNRGALSLELHDASVAMTWRDEDGHIEWSVRIDIPLIDYCWYAVSGTLSAGTVRLHARPLDPLYGDPVEITVEQGHNAVLPTAEWTVAARQPSRIEATGTQFRGRAEDCFTGKVEAPFVLAGELKGNDLVAWADEDKSPDLLFGNRLIAAWNFALDSSREVTVAQPVAMDQLAGTVVNLPSRAVTGRRFSGDTLDFRSAPEEYAAIHFHSTDVVDIGWAAALDSELPAQLDSGVYGLVVRSAAGSDTVPIIVVPPEGASRRQRIAVILPTFSYLAYANENLFDGLDTSAMTPKQVVIDEVDRAHVGDRTFGLSMYDKHLDGSGVMYSSARRAIVNFRRGYRMWLNDGGRGFSADMYLVEWLDRLGFEFDVITDVEVHERGPEYLAHYSVLLSGSHPEYTSSKMLDTLESYRDAGGSLMYLGGNGWYWVTGVVDNAPLTVEIRRGMAGIRCWESYPGEVTLVSTGEPGGLWRHRGRAPQKLTGVGMAAQGWGSSEPYFRSVNAGRPDLQWIFDGVEPDPIGAYGFSMNGAAGDELDRFDHALGSPPGTVIVASSRGHSNYYQRALEEIAMNLPDQGGGQQDPEVRADITYFSTPKGGEVFSVGSIAWSGALLHNNTDNGVSRMTANVVRTFVKRRERT